MRTAELKAVGFEPTTRAAQQLDEVKKPKPIDAIYRFWVKTDTKEEQKALEMDLKSVPGVLSVNRESTRKGAALRFEVSAGAGEDPDAVLRKVKKRLSKSCQWESVYTVETELDEARLAKLKGGEKARVLKALNARRIMSLSIGDVRGTKALRKALERVDRLGWKRVAMIWGDLSDPKQKKAVLASAEKFWRSLSNEQQMQAMSYVKEDLDEAKKVDYVLVDRKGTPLKAADAGRTTMKMAPSTAEIMNASQRLKRHGWKWVKEDLDERPRFERGDEVRFRGSMQRGTVIKAVEDRDHEGLYYEVDFAGQLGTQLVLGRSLVGLDTERKLAWAGVLRDAGFEPTTRAAHELGSVRASVEENVPDPKLARKALKDGYKFVVFDPGVGGMGVDPYYAKTKKEAKEAVKSNRKLGATRSRIVDLKTMVGESLDEATLSFKKGLRTYAIHLSSKNEITAVDVDGKRAKDMTTAVKTIMAITATRVPEEIGKKRWNKIKWPTQYKDLRNGQPFEHKGRAYLKLSTNLAVDDEGQVVHSMTAYHVVKPVRRFVVSEALNEVGLLQCPRCGWEGGVPVGLTCPMCTEILINIRSGTPLEEAELEQLHALQELREMNEWYALGGKDPIEFLKEDLIYWSSQGAVSEALRLIEALGDPKTAWYGGAEWRWGTNSVVVRDPWWSRLSHVERESIIEAGVDEAKLKDKNKKAFAAGQQAYKDGVKRAPISNKKFMRSVLAVRGAERNKAMKDYLRGWDSANLADESLEEQVRPKAKRTQEEANYRRTDDADKRCGNCAYIEFPGGCKRVAGKIDQDWVCDLFKRGVHEAFEHMFRTGHFHAEFESWKELNEVDVKLSADRLNRHAVEMGMQSDREFYFRVSSGDYEIRFFADHKGKMAAAYVADPPRMYKKWRLAKNTNADRLWKTKIRPHIDKLVMAAREDRVEA